MTVARIDTLPPRPSDKPVVHLADLQHPARTLCGAPLTDAEVGAYVEELDSTNADGDASWSRCIYPLCGGDAEPCASCLARQRPVLGTSFIARVEPVNTAA